jgi:hypothetical protein
MKCVSKFKFSKNQLKNLSHDILREYIIDSLNKEIDIETSKEWPTISTSISRFFLSVG